MNSRLNLGFCGADGEAGLSRQHFLNFLPDLQEQGSFGLVLGIYKSIAYGSCPSRRVLPKKELPTASPIGILMRMTSYGQRRDILHPGRLQDTNSLKLPLRPSASFFGVPDVPDGLRRSIRTRVVDAGFVLELVPTVCSGK